MTQCKVFHCNKTYGEGWLKDKQRSNGIQYKIIQAVIELASKSNGGAITQSDLLEYYPAIKEYLERRKFKVVPGSGTELRGNGRGIHHAKYSPTKSVAVLWVKIRETVYITFDDHAPVKYHRAIYSFHQLRLGRKVFPLNGKCSRLTREILRSNKPWRYKGVDLRKRYYY